MLRALDLPADLVATSGEWGYAKPSAEFFARVVDATDASPHETLYVGDHPANDVFPVRESGLLTAHLRRGPWGYLWADDPTVMETADWQINGLVELVDIVTGSAG